MREDLDERLRREADISARPGQMDRLNALADEFAVALESSRADAARLEEALCGLKDLMLRQAKWKPCDCGCPQQRTPDGPHSVTWLRAAQQVEIAISKAKAEGKE